MILYILRHTHGRSFNKLSDVWLSSLSNKYKSADSNNCVNQDIHSCHMHETALLNVEVNNILLSTFFFFFNFSIYFDENLLFINVFLSVVGLTLFFDRASGETDAAPYLTCCSSCLPV